MENIEIKEEVCPQLEKSMQDLIARYRNNTLTQKEKDIIKSTFSDTERREREKEQARIFLEWLES